MHACTAVLCLPLGVSAMHVLHVGSQCRCYLGCCSVGTLVEEDAGPHPVQSPQRTTYRQYKVAATREQKRH